MALEANKNTSSANILRMASNGYAPAEISQQLGVPASRVHYVVSTNSGRIEKEEKRRTQLRTAFQQVMQRYFDITSVLGNPGALDYSKVTGGCGAQYAKRDAFTLIDYTVDVRTTAERMRPASRELFKAVLETQEVDPAVKTQEYLDLEEEGGRLFVANGLYPVAEYFGGGSA